MKSEAGSRKPEVSATKIFVLLSSDFCFLASCVQHSESGNARMHRVAGGGQRILFVSFRQRYEIYAGKSASARKISDAGFSEVSGKISDRFRPVYAFRSRTIRRKRFASADAKCSRRTKPISQILLFWKDDARSEQREIKVEAVKQNDKWLINNISNQTSSLQNILNH